MFKVPTKLHQVLVILTGVLTVVGWIAGQLSALDAVSVGSVLAIVAGGLDKLHNL